MNALVLAGGPPDAVAALQPQAPNKAFIEINGKTLVKRTVEGLHAAAVVERIIVVAPPAAHEFLQQHVAPDEIRPDSIRISESLQNGLEGLPPNELVLVAASDMPVLTGESVEDFVVRAQSVDPDIGYGCLEKRIHMARFPQVPHTWVRLREGTFCGGGLIVLKPRALPSLLRFIERLGAARKNPLQLASLFGWNILFRFALRQLTIARAEQRASELLGLPARAIVSPYAEIAVNVDRVSDVALAEQLTLPSNA